MKPHAATPFVGILGETFYPTVAGSVDIEVIELAIRGKITLTPVEIKSGLIFFLINAIEALLYAPRLSNTLPCFSSYPQVCVFLHLCWRAVLTDIWHWHIFYCIIFFTLQPHITLTSKSCNYQYSCLTFHLDQVMYKALVNKWSITPDYASFGDIHCFYLILL